MQTKRQKSNAKNIAIIAKFILRAIFTYSELY